MARENCQGGEIGTTPPGAIATDTNRRDRPQQAVIADRIGAGWSGGDR